MSKQTAEQAVDHLLSWAIKGGMDESHARDDAADIYSALDLVRDVV